MAFRLSICSFCRLFSSAFLLHFLNCFPFYVVNIFLSISPFFCSIFFVFWPVLFVHLMPFLSPRSLASSFHFCIESSSINPPLSIYCTQFFLRLIASFSLSSSGRSDHTSLKRNKTKKKLTVRNSSITMNSSFDFSFDKNTRSTITRPDTRLKMSLVCRRK